MSVEISTSIIDQINEIRPTEYSLKAFNNDHTPFDFVVGVLMYCVPMSQDQAEALAWKIHKEGSAIVYTGTEIKCEELKSDLKEIRVDSVIVIH